jgi:hypothetical protein
MPLGVRVLIPQLGAGVELAWNDPSIPASQVAGITASTSRLVFIFETGHLYAAQVGFKLTLFLPKPPEY